MYKSKSLLYSLVSHVWTWLGQKCIVLGQDIGDPYLSCIASLYQLAIRSSIMIFNSVIINTRVGEIERRQKAAVLSLPMPTLYRELQFDISVAMSSLFKLCLPSQCLKYFSLNWQTSLLTINYTYVHTNTHKGAKS